MAYGNNNGSSFGAHLTTIEAVVDEIARIRDNVKAGISKVDNVNMLGLMIRRKVYHYCGDSRTEKKVVRDTINIAYLGAAGMKLFPDAVPLWTLRQLLRRELHTKGLEAALKHLCPGYSYGAGTDGPPLNEDRSEKADRESDPMVRRWDVAKLERDLKLLETPVALYGEAAVTRRRQIARQIIMLKIATESGKNTPHAARDEVLSWAMQTVNDFAYSVADVKATGLLALCAPSTNRGQEYVDALAGIPVVAAAPPAEPKPKPTKSEPKHPILMMPQPKVVKSPDPMSPDLIVHDPPAPAPRKPARPARRRLISL